LTESLQAVVPSITREQAIDLFSSRTSSFFSKLSRQPAAPIRTELLYIPYYRFVLELSGATEEPLARIAIDGLLGEGVFFMTGSLELEPFGDERRCDFALSPATAREIASDQYKRLLLEHGLRNKSKTTVSSISEAELLLFPFWIAYTRKGDSYDFKALDAVSGEAQGIRMRKVFLTAFRQLKGGGLE
jgi:hypothetical protein